MTIQSCAGEYPPQVTERSDAEIKHVPVLLKEALEFLLVSAVRPPTVLLGEALVETGFEPPAPEARESGVEAGTHRQCIRLWSVGETAYIDRGWIEK